MRPRCSHRGGYRELLSGFYFQLLRGNASVPGASPCSATPPPFTIVVAHNRWVDCHRQGSNFVAPFHHPCFAAQFPLRDGLPTYASTRSVTQQHAVGMACLPHRELGFNRYRCSRRFLHAGVAAWWTAPFRQLSLPRLILR